MKTRTLLLAATAAVLGSAFAMTAFAGPQPEKLTVYVMPGHMGLLGPDGLHHDSIEPASFVLHKGVPVTISVINYDDAMHSITAPDLGVNIMIKPGVHTKGGENDQANAAEDVDTTPEDGVKPTVTTYTFTPNKVGEFRWNCMIPCDGGKTKHWAMSPGAGGPDQIGYMAGYFTVL
jgi:uncharacterized cupredoxin-like copper-binding protein